MSRNSADEVSFTFCDVVACFSENEQKLLHDWQKELYNNVMKEIRQALNSLGPLIANSVFSLKPREQEEPSSADLSDSEMKPSINTFTAVDATPEFEMFRQYQCSMDAQDTGERERHNVPVNEQKPKMTKQMSSICINEEGETYTVNIQEYQSSPAGDGVMTRNENIGNSVKHNIRSRLCKSTSNRAKENVIHSMPEGEVSRSPIWSGCDQETNTEKIEQCQIGHHAEMLCKVPLVAPSVQKAHANNKGENVMRKFNVPSQSNQQQSFRSYTYLESKKISQNNSSVSQKAKGKYACAECGKSFAATSTLVTHERIHTGERPYQCDVCAKSFNQKGALHRHQISHTEEKPYQCNVCGKRFNLKHNLVGHQKIHVRAQ